ncbi:MAG: Ornithine carbamoyltransferase [bacterium ADurb.Bin236]|nr:MAG: Ornithine carbamoyltransferase [bacterium ADurb.Bin236]HOY62909.1 ornithine carbamoyltransferase [bacterium]HPN93770.1 ornithine carbamoyltransferase [bacterium]
MTVSLKGRDLIDLKNYTAVEIQEIISVASALKSELKDAGRHARLPLAGKSIALYFEKQSLRTRVSFEVGIHQLGGQTIFINSGSTHSGRGEPLMDTARVLSRYIHGIVYRAYNHEDVKEMAEHSGAPVINALCDKAHPCQALADLLTIYEHRGRGVKTKVAYIGDAENNVASSLTIVLAKVGIDVSLGCPESYGPSQDVMSAALADAKKSGARIEVFKNPEDAVRGANIVYTDVWISMGDEGETERRKKAFAGYEVTPKLMSLAAHGALFMHDMPAHRGEEVHPDVMDGDRSIVIDQAENRLHAQKAVMALLIGE